MQIRVGKARLKFSDGDVRKEREDLNKNKSGGVLLARKWFFFAILYSVLRYK